MKRRIKNGLVSLLCCVTLFNCIQEVDIFKGSNPTLVVDGVVTNEPGPHKVRLSFSTEYNTPPVYGRVERATVKIVDDLGNEESLTYSGNGVYTTSAGFTGIIGRSYFVHVVLASGEEYRSHPEKLLPVPAIEGIRYERHGSQIRYYVNFTDNKEEKNYYRWRYSGVYEVIAPIAYELSLKPGPRPPGHCYSGVFTPERTWRCWVSDFDSQYLNIESDLLFNGRSVEDFLVFSDELNRRYDRGRRIEIKQYSLTAEAHHYWQAIDAQMGNNGTIFETANYQIRGNLYSVDNDDELILGYFGASAVSRAEVFVPDFVGAFGPIECVTNNAGCYPERCLDCLKYSPSATNIKPGFWPF